MQTLGYIRIAGYDSVGAGYYRELHINYTYFFQHITSLGLEKKKRSVGLSEGRLKCILLYVYA